jgi:hypothetical protein
MVSTMVTDAWIADATLICAWPSPLEADKELTLLSGLSFCAEYGLDADSFMVPAGFKTDLASDPLDRRGTWDYGSVVHDYLYVCKGSVENSFKETVLFSRKECDDIFYYIMQQCLPEDASIYMKLKNKVTWLAVRLFGAKSWNS